MVDIADRNEKAAAAADAGPAERKPWPRWVITLASIWSRWCCGRSSAASINPVFGSYPSAIAVAFWEWLVTGQLGRALYESLRPFVAWLWRWRS